MGYPAHAVLTNHRSRKHSLSSFSPLFPSLSFFPSSFRLSSFGVGISRTTLLSKVSDNHMWNRPVFSSYFRFLGWARAQMCLTNWMRRKQSNPLPLSTYKSSSKNSFLRQVTTACLSLYNAEFIDICRIKEKSKTCLLSKPPCSQGGHWFLQNVCVSGLSPLKSHESMKKKN